MMEIEKYLLNIFLKFSYFFAQLKCAYNDRQYGESHCSQNITEQTARSGPERREIFRDGIVVEFAEWARTTAENEAGQTCSHFNWANHS